MKPKLFTIALITTLAMAPASVIASDYHNRYGDSYAKNTRSTPTRQAHKVFQYSPKNQYLRHKNHRDEHRRYYAPSIISVIVGSIAGNESRYLSHYDKHYKHSNRYQKQKWHKQRKHYNGYKKFHYYPKHYSSKLRKHHSAKEVWGNRSRHYHGYRH